MGFQSGKLAISLIGTFWTCSSLVGFYIRKSGGRLFQLVSLITGWSLSLSYFFQHQTSMTLDDSEAFSRDARFSSCLFCCGHFSDRRALVALSPHHVTTVLKKPSCGNFGMSSLMLFFVHRRVRGGEVSVNPLPRILAPGHSLPARWSLQGKDFFLSQVGISTGETGVFRFLTWSMTTGARISKTHLCLASNSYPSLPKCRSSHVLRCSGLIRSKGTRVVTHLVLSCSSLVGMSRRYRNMDLIVDHCVCISSAGSPEVG